MAVTFDYGNCAQCGNQNPKAIDVCRDCGTTLPWAKNALKTEAARSAPSSGGASGGGGMGNIDWGPLAIGLFGGAVFIGGAFLWCGNVFGFFPTFPMVGYITMLIGGAIFKAGSGGGD